MKCPQIGFAALLLVPLSVLAELPGKLAKLVEQNCSDCHDKETAEGGLDLTTLSFDPKDRGNRDRWIRIHDRVEKGEMPPPTEDLPKAEREALVKLLAEPIAAAERAEIATQGRGPMRRLNRDEYEQNLRDLLHLPHLDIRDMLPADREAHHFTKVSDTLDISRVQLTAYLDAADSALRQAMVTEKNAPPVNRQRVVGKDLSSRRRTAGSAKAMFLARDGKGFDLSEDNSIPIVEEPLDPSVELVLFRSPGWPYSVFPKGVVATRTGDYRVKFSARAVVQTEGFLLGPATRTVPMTFRSRRPTGHDIAEDVRSTGGIIDIQPDGGIYEATVRLRAGQTIEYGAFGLPVPWIDAQGKAGSYRYPPFPKGGQPGIAFQWLEMEGPLPPDTWPPASHRVLFDDLAPGAPTQHPAEDARRLLRRFIQLAAREPVPEDAIPGFEQLVLSRLARGATLAEALLAGYQAFLSSDLFLYLREPRPEDDCFRIANRLSHFLTNSRPDAALAELAGAGKLRDSATLRRETERLIAGDGFERFVDHFTDSWLGLRDLRRDDPDVRLYPEYRLDDYLVESMGMETRAFFGAIIRENLPSTALIDCDFTFVNERLAEHYGLPLVVGSAVRKVDLPKGSQYGGLLTQAAILKISANGTSTSPVLRGVWIMDRLIGQPPPPPPPNVPAVEPDIRGAKTIRDLLALHTKSKSCAACHASFDPVGLALENFDVFGAWRTRYRGSEEGDRIIGIDRAGHDFSYTLAGSVDAGGKLADGRSFKNIHELKELFAGNPRQLARNLLHQFALYATGVPIRFADRAEVESMLDACARKGYRARDLLHALIQSQIFLGEQKS